MSNPVVSSATNLVILLALVALTLLTVGLSFLEVDAAWHVVMGISIAIVKGSLVALFFMHLIHSRITTWAVVAVTVFWVTVVLMLLTFSDYATRSLFPFVPGH